VTTIEAGAFEKNKLTSIIIPNSVRTIKEGAFAYSYTRECCINHPGLSTHYFRVSNKITEVTIGANVAIADGAFGSLKEGNYAGNAFEKIYINNKRRAGTYVYGKHLGWDKNKTEDDAVEDAIQRAERAMENAIQTAERAMEKARDAKRTAEKNNKEKAAKKAEEAMKKAEEAIEMTKTKKTTEAWKMARDAMRMAEEAVGLNRTLLFGFGFMANGYLGDEKLFNDKDNEKNSDKSSAGVSIGMLTGIQFTNWLAFNSEFYFTGRVFNNEDCSTDCTRIVEYVLDIPLTIKLSMSRYGYYSETGVLYGIPLATKVYASEAYIDREKPDFGYVFGLGVMGPKSSMGCRVIWNTSDFSKHAKGSFYSVGFLMRMGIL
jgi:hypothetical protein